jgi:hypothetical protein
LFETFRLHLSIRLTILTPFFFLGFIGFLDEFFPLSDNFEEQIDILKVADWKIPHEILSVDLRYFSCYGYLLFLSVLAAKIVLGVSVLTGVTLHGYKPSSSVYTNGWE